jgi:hypothetical protein
VCQIQSGRISLGRRTAKSIHVSHAEPAIP